MPVLKKDVGLPEAAEVEMVTCRVREEGHGKISTGNHYAQGGEECWALGDEIQLSKDTALKYSGKIEPEHGSADQRQYWVDIIPAKPAKAA